MIRCRLCVIPNTRPDTHFVDGVCSACIAYEKRKGIDWNARKRDLLALLERHGGRCIVPSSGGKDSHWQVLTLLELGAEVTIVTATTCMLTDVGRRNIDNLARYATTIEVTPNRSVRAKLNRLGLQLVGDISWPEHVSIFTTPFKVALRLGIPLIFYGENPQNQYGGPPGSEEARTMTRRWVSEFGGFLGLRPRDLIGTEGLTERDMGPYMPPSPTDIERAGVEAHFLGQYLPWDSHRNAEVAQQNGMRQFQMHRGDLIANYGPSEANRWGWENLDNAMTGLHDHAMYRKYGYGRGAAQVSIDIRAGDCSREHGLWWVRAHDGLFPFCYADVYLDAVLAHIGMSDDDLVECLNRFTDWSLFEGVERGRPILKDFACSPTA